MSAPDMTPTALAVAVLVEAWRRFTEPDDRCDHDETARRIAIDLLPARLAAWAKWEALVSLESGEATAPTTIDQAVYYAFSIFKNPRWDDGETFGYLAVEVWPLVRAAISLVRNDDDAHDAVATVVADLDAADVARDPQAFAPIFVERYLAAWRDLAGRHEVARRFEGSPRFEREIELGGYP